MELFNQKWKLCHHLLTLMLLLTLTFYSMGFSLLLFEEKNYNKNILAWIKREICTDQALYTSKNSSKQIIWWNLTWRRTFFTGGIIIMDYVHVFSEAMKCLNLFLTNMQTFHFTRYHSMDWSCLVDYCDVFIRCLDSHSDGTHSLQRIRWWASDVMLNFSKSVLMKKKKSYTSWIAWG